MTLGDPDPNEAYEVHPSPEEPHGPKGWWTVTCNGIPVRHASDREKAVRYATDPAHRAEVRRREVKLHDRKPREKP